MNNAELKTPEWKALCAEFKRSTAPVCGVCGKSIDLSLSGRDPMGWSLDHIKPRKTHPHLVYDRKNLRPTHMKCNSERNGGAHTGKTSRRYG